YRVHFEQRQPCNSGSVPIYPFLQAWASEPTAARAEKLHELFASAACTRDTDESAIESYIATAGVIKLGYRQRVYAYHSAAVELAADAIAWDTTYSGANGLELLERHVLGERAITVYETATPGTPRVADMTCRQRIR